MRNAPSAICSAPASTSESIATPRTRETSAPATPRKAGCALASATMLPMRTATEARGPLIWQAVPPRTAVTSPATKAVSAPASRPWPIYAVPSGAKTIIADVTAYGRLTMALANPPRRSPARFGKRDTAATAVVECCIRTSPQPLWWPRPRLHNHHPDELLLAPGRADRYIGKPRADHEPEQQHPRKRDHGCGEVEVHVADGFDQR